MTEYIEREAAYDTLTGYYHHSTDTQHGALREALNRVPAADVVPWETLMRYANYFCAAVSMPEFVREAKMFYYGTKAAMDGGNIE